MKKYTLLFNSSIEKHSNNIIVLLNYIYNMVGKTDITILNNKTNEKHTIKDYIDYNILLEKVS